MKAGYQKRNLQLGNLPKKGDRWMSIEQGALWLSRIKSKPVYGSFLRWLFRKPKYWVVTHDYVYKPYQVYR